MMKTKSIIILLILVLTPILVNGQDKVVKGEVTAFNSYAVKGAEVKAKKSKQVTETDSLGRFEITCKKKDVIYISAKGFTKERISVNNTNTIDCNMILLPGDVAIDNVIEGGYLDEKDIEYAVENLMGENNDFSRYQDICDLLQAKYPMVSCSQFNGENRVFIGTQPQSLGAGHFALCVVDGVITDDISDISPMQVASIKVLSADDAASYGSRGACGVVEIELKNN